jgi:hypothetical protein
MMLDGEDLDGSKMSDPRYHCWYVDPVQSGVWKHGACCCAAIGVSFRPFSLMQLLAKDIIVESGSCLRYGWWPGVWDCGDCVPEGMQT